MKLLLPIFLLFTVLNSCARYSAADTLNDPTGTQLSHELLKAEKVGQRSQEYVKALAGLDPKKLLAELDTKEKKLAFWINIYNGLVQHLLAEQPDLWENRNSFFSDPRFTIAGQELSLEDVEHGIIRGGEAKLGLGFLPKLFPGKFERSFKIKGGDARIHFAINCGAIDCPPVEIYDPATIDDRLDHRTRSYLKKFTEVDPKEEEITTTPLFSWFRGDFRPYDGIDDFLVYFEIISEAQKSYSKSFRDYDWTLATDVWAQD